MKRSLSVMALRHVQAAGDHAGTGGHAHSRPHDNLPFGPEQYIHARAEFDEPDPFALGDPVARLLGKHNAAGNQPRNLLEHNACALTLHGKEVLLVLYGALLAAGHQKLSLLILHIANGAANRRAVYVNVEDVEEN